MSRFFLAIGLIFCITTVILLYYWTKQLIKYKHNKNIINTIHKKYYYDRKEYLKNYLSYQLPLLIENKIQWILIRSKHNPILRTEITYNSLKQKIVLHIREVFQGKQHIQSLERLGITSVDKLQNETRIQMPVNAKIVTDVIYYIFEYIYQLKILQKYKITTS